MSIDLRQFNNLTKKCLYCRSNALTGFNTCNRHLSKEYNVGEVTNREKYYSHGRYRTIFETIPKK